MASENKTRARTGGRSGSASRASMILSDAEDAPDSGSGRSAGAERVAPSRAFADADFAADEREYEAVVEGRTESFEGITGLTREQAQAAREYADASLEESIASERASVAYRRRGMTNSAISRIQNPAARQAEAERAKEGQRNYTRAKRAWDKTRERSKEAYYKAKDVMPDEIMTRVQSATTRLEVDAVEQVRRELGVRSGISYNLSASR